MTDRSKGKVVGLYPLLWCVSVLGMVSCGGPQQAQPRTLEAPHMDGRFLEWRARSLGVTLEAAAAREERLPGVGGPPPYEVLDVAMAEEAARVWAAACAACHGVDGRPPKDAQPKPRSWGTMGVAMGFFFGGDKMRSGIYRVISEGRAPHMPPWQGRLSREQIWALVRHIEGF